MEREYPDPAERYENLHHEHLEFERWVEESCECGMTEDEVWSEKLFDEAGCTCT